MIATLAPAALAKSRPKRTASYLASLLVVENWRRTAHSIVSFIGDRSMTLALSARWLDELSVHIIHAIDFSFSSFPVVNSVMKSTKACALIAVLGQYWTSNSSSLIAYRTSCPVASGLFIIFRGGLSVWTLWCALGSTAWVSEQLWSVRRPAFPLGDISLQLPEVPDWCSI